MVGFCRPSHILSIRTELDIMNMIPYTYKFLRDVNFVDDANLGFPQFYFRGSLDNKHE